MQTELKDQSNSEQLTKKVPPKKQAYEKHRRKYLTAHEVDKLEAAAKKRGRYGERDALMIRMCYRHALRAGELVALTWDQVEFESGELRVTRLKNGKSGNHLLKTDEKRRLRKLMGDCEYVFMNERGTPLDERAFFKIVQLAGEAAGIGHVNPHMLRHAAGYELINEDVDLRTIQDYMGHKNIQNTAMYTELNSKKFKRVNLLLK